MTRRNRPTRAQPAPIAQDAKPATDTAEQQRAWARLLEETKMDNRSPSMQQAERYKVSEQNYTKREKQAAELAMDFNGDMANALTFVQNVGFPGFPSLALLSQLAEYRSMHERLADEVIRMWGKVTSTGTTPPEKLAAIEDALRKIDVRAVVRQATIHDQAFGGGHVFIKLKGDETQRELPLVLEPYTVKRGSLEGLRVVEPYWVTPNYYNSIDPSAADFYKPSSWWMLGMQVHATRLQTIVSRPVADMLKPTYSFRGVSMTQLAMPYVDNWLRTRQSVSDAVKQFAVSGLKTDMQQMLQPGGSVQMQNRAQLVNQYRDNRNILLIDMAQEEFFTVATPLAGLHELQAQAQEQMSAVSHIPLVVLLGITPTGLNASSEGEIRVFYDYVRGYQTNTVSPLMQNVIKLIQLSDFGEIDDAITWQWEPLQELTSMEKADARAKDAETDTKYIETGVLQPEQVAKRLNADEQGLYSGLLDSSELPLEDIPDDDIEGITAKILDIGEAPVLASQAGKIAQAAIEPADDDISGIADQIEQIGESDETAANAGETAEGTGGDPTGLGDPGALPEGAAAGSSEHERELSPLGTAPVQGRPDGKPISRPTA